MLVNFVQSRSVQFSSVQSPIPKKWLVYIKMKIVLPKQNGLAYVTFGFRTRGGGGRRLRGRELRVAAQLRGGAGNYHIKLSGPPFWRRDVRHNYTQHNDTQHNDTPYDIQYNDTQHNDTLHNDTQHNVHK
jgi:hypothetical protein